MLKAKLMHLLIESSKHFTSSATANHRNVSATGRSKLRVRRAFSLASVLSLSLTAALFPIDGVPSQVESASAATAKTALSTLHALAVKGRAPKTGYERSLFSDGWGDQAWGCDTRNFILKRDLTSIVMRPNETCIVASGVLKDPYTLKTISFVRGVKTSLAVQIDHVVAVSDAWQKGAQQISSQQRYNFYNDPLNLLAVDGPTNSSKGDGDAATWLPPNKGYRCAYVARQVAVKAKYKLWVTTAEKAAIAGVLAKCPKQPLPTK
jgi:hypothetical protein